MEGARYIVILITSDSIEEADHIALPIIGSNQDYLEWIEQSVA
jgi:uncharacterized protein involved in tolerance to divalent cations